MADDHHSIARARAHTRGGRPFARSSIVACDKKQGNCQKLQTPSLRYEHRLREMKCLAAASRRLLFSLCASAAVQNCRAQDLAPRAYIITPIHSNAITLSYTFLDGSLIFDGSVPITGASARVNLSTIALYHSFKFFGRSANFTAVVPYGVGNFNGTVVGAETHAYRSGLLPAAFRFSVNLLGGPAMDVEQFRKWRQKTLLGISFKLVPPTGQYDPTKLINYGSNRWALKPEIGYSRRRGHWILEAYGGAWIFTDNPEFFSRNQYVPGINQQSQNPIGSFEGHLNYDFKPRLWVSIDGNFWFGGSTSLNGAPSPGTSQRNSRVGATGSIPLNRHQSVKFSYSNGAYIRYGGNYQSVSAGWQYSWLGRPN